jgi:hypothetical protein
MLTALTSTVFAIQDAAEQMPPASSTARFAVRVALGILIATLLTYIAIEQIGSWRRRRFGRD